MAVALIVAAGRGERLGSDKPKALVTLAGTPMLGLSIRTLRQLPEVERIVIALPPGINFDASSPVVIVPGGATRSESVREALRAAGDGDPVIVHDAARPLAPPELFERVLDELSSSGADAAIAAAPVSDTVKEVGDDGRTVTRTVDRSRLWAAQTPQAFRRDALERAVMDASADVLAAATDDAWLVERVGGVVRLVEADPSNIKITSPTDLRVAEMLLSER